MSSFKIHIISLIMAMFLIAGCQAPHVSGQHYKDLSKDDKYNTKYKGHYKVGKPYQIKGKTYSPKQVTNYTKVGTASWYGSRHGFHGKKTANGDLYNKNLLTAAHKTLPMPSLVEVTNLENKRSLIVMVNDRGPYAGNREIDLSEKAATLLGFKNQGIAKVKVKYLHKETKKFIALMGLQDKEGTIAKSNLKSTHCTVNCHLKLFNIKHKNITTKT